MSTFYITIVFKKMIKVGSLYNLLIQLPINTDCMLGYILFLFWTTLQELPSILRLSHQDLGHWLSAVTVQGRLLPPGAHQMDVLGGINQGEALDQVILL